MASKTFARTLRTASKQKIGVAAIPTRTFVSVQAVRPAVTKQAGLTAVPIQQTRGVKTIDFAGTKEQVFGMWIVADGRAVLTCNRAIGLAQGEAPGWSCD